MFRIITPLLFLFVAAQVCTAIPPRDPTAIQEVADGKRDTADATWWGFAPADATAALQGAINSKAKRVIVPNVGAPWIVTGINLASDQEVVFEKGVEVQAKRGAFKDSNACLFSANEKKNIRLTGPGATLRMWKADYQSAAYSKAEWRHALSFWSCEGVEVTGLSIIESGGDGIYLGCNSLAKPNTDVVIRDVRFLDHHRQGISVICAERLVIENCVLSGTSGTAPQAGIDFEPNDAAERLVDCVMRNCTLEGNAGGGFLFALGKMRPSSKPISITIENCTSTRDSQAVALGMHPPVGVGGTITFTQCRFADSTQGGVFLRNLHAGSALLSFVKCQFVNLADKSSNGAPICFRSDTFGKVVGGVRFDDCVIEDSSLRRPITFQNAGSLPMRDVTGRITVKATGTEQVHELTEKLIHEWFPSQLGLVNLPVIECDPHKLAPAWPQSGTVVFGAGSAKQRHDSHFVVWARQGQRVSLTLTNGVVGKDKPKPLAATLLSPSGKPVPLEGADAVRTFVATEPGAYRLQCKPGSNTIQVHSPSAPVSAFAPDGAFSFIYPAGDQYFLVPSGVGEFAITIGGDGLERVKASVFDSAGRQVWSHDNIDAPRQFHQKRSDTSRDEVWSLRCDIPSQGVCEDYQILIEGIPPLLAASPESVLSLRGTPATSKPPHAPRILLVGDSTVASYPTPPKDRPTLTGWGQVLGEFLPPGARVTNRAVSGASLRSFFERGSWQEALKEPFDYVLIQFGHNDQKLGERYADPASSYPDFLRGYIGLARAYGARPVLVTSVGRFRFENGALLPSILTPWVEAVKQLGTQEHIPVIDLHAMSLALYEKLGEKGMAAFNPVITPGQKDTTHFSRVGAQQIAKLVADELVKVMR